MKTYQQKLTRWFLIVLILFPPFTSCVEEAAVKDCDGAGIGESAVRFSVWLPGSSRSTRSLTGEEESHVQTIDILMFEQGGGAWKYKAGVSGAAIATDDTDATKKTFTITMRHGDYDLVMFANARERIVALDLAGMTRDQVLALFTEDVPSGGKWIADEGATGYKPIPMWGEIGDITIDDDTEITDADGVILTRMVARVDVVIAPSVSNFTITSVDVYNYNTKGSLAPLSTAWNPSANPPRATAPNIPAGSILTKGPLEYNNGGGKSEINAAANKCEREIYIFEAENHTGTGHASPKDHLDRTCIVVGGVYGTDTAPTYYRADFSTGTGDAETFLDVLRNHHYTFTVTKVNGPGYATSEEAFQGAKPIEFTVDVTPWGRDNNVPLPWTVRESSNCYIVTSGEKPFNIPVYGQVGGAISNGDLPGSWITSDMTLGAELIWSEGGATSVIKQLRIYDYSEITKSLLTVWPGESEGNAVVGVFNDLNGNGTREAGESILWSWHIWSMKPENKPVEINGWLDRDLGSLRERWVVAGSSVDPVQPLYYQAGRKDPMPLARIPQYGSLVTDGTGNSVGFSINNPTVNITDWDYPNYNRWNNGGTKTIFDPCPEGFKVPSSVEITSFQIVGTTSTWERIAGGIYWPLYYEVDYTSYGSGFTYYTGTWTYNALIHFGYFAEILNGTEEYYDRGYMYPASNNVVRCIRDM